MRKYTPIRTAIPLVAVALALCATACGDTPDGDTYRSYNSVTASVMTFAGQWKIGSQTNQRSTMTIYPNYLAFSQLPYMAILQEIFADAASVAITADDSNSRIPYKATTTDDGSILYTVQAMTWNLHVEADDKPHDIQIIVAPKAGNADDTSWGTLSGTGVLTVILHVTAYRMDGQAAVTMPMRLTYTATRQ